MAFGANFAAICFAEDMLRDRIRINRLMWEIFRETDQLLLQLPARATVCRPDLLCLLFGEEVARCIPLRCKLSPAGEVADRLRRSPNGKAKGSGPKERRSTKGSYALRSLDGPERTWSRFRGSSAAR